MHPLAPQSGVAGIHQHPPASISNRLRRPASTSIHLHPLESAGIRWQRTAFTYIYQQRPASASIHQHLLAVAGIHQHPPLSQKNNRHKRPGHHTAAGAFSDHADADHRPAGEHHTDAVIHGRPIITSITPVYSRLEVTKCLRPADYYFHLPRF